MTAPFRPIPSILDTNLYIDWINQRARPELFEHPRLKRYLSGVVLMELYAGAHTKAAQRNVAQLAETYYALQRFWAPARWVYERAGHTLRLLRGAGRDVRRASFVNDVLIAGTARQWGAKLFTADRDYEAIWEVDRFDLELVD